MSNDPVVTCSACGAIVNASAGEDPEARTPCFVCGSADRHVAITLEETVHLKSMLDLKGKPPTGKWFVHTKVGDELFRLKDQWHRLTRVIDRRAGRYFEHIEGAETGAVQRHVDEPLRNHRGRGSARRPRK